MSVLSIAFNCSEFAQNLLRICSEFAQNFLRVFQDIPIAFNKSTFEFRPVCGLNNKLKINQLKRKLMQNSTKRKLNIKKPLGSLCGNKT